MLTDLDYIRQSVRDILLTPVGTRVMRRQYGSLLSTLNDQAQNEELRLQIMSACYMAPLRQSSPPE
ncbi:Baseplate assembly protein W (GpW) [Pantoea agglomerans]|nr:Baseplate assembly protein W (GpW) [Pantoea agglomerans]